MLSEDSRIKDFTAEALGSDLLRRVFMTFRLPLGLLNNPILRQLKLKTLGRVVGKDLIRTLLLLVNTKQDEAACRKPAERPDWYRDAVFYQIYPLCFCDGNGDGIGDLEGIIRQIDYLAELGVNALWLSPIFDSPNDDNGYDISDYRKIMREMGTMADFDRLIAACKSKGLRLILDLVVNHCSVEHEWYQKALAGDTKYQDYFFFREGRIDENGVKQAPNNWRSFFSGPAWRYEPSLDRWVLALFAKSQVDLNWDNADLRREVHEIARFWLDKGVDGFRLDVINYISKREGLPEGNAVVGELMQFYGIEHYVYGPKLYPYLRALQEEVFTEFGAFSIGETPGLGPKTGAFLTDPKRGALDLIFCFDHLEMPGFTRFDDYRYDLNYYKRFLLDYEGEPTLFFENHDNPRMLGKVQPPVGLEPYLAKLLGFLLLTRPGTTFIYQGQELGMGNVDFKSVDEFKDVESINLYQECLAEGMEAEEALQKVIAGSRDHARAPLDWSLAEAQQKDVDSVFAFYRKSIALRGKYSALRRGAVEELYPRKNNLFAYVRRHEGVSLLAVANLCEQEIKLPRLPEGEVLLTNYTGGPETVKLRPYEVFLKRIDH